MVIAEAVSETFFSTRVRLQSFHTEVVRKHSIMMQRILVVEDDEANLDFLTMALSDEGYEVAVAKNGHDGLQLAQTFSPHLIFLDMRMPQVNGETFLELYRKEAGYNTPIIASSASRAVDERALELGADFFLPKPFSLVDLLQSVHKYLQASKH
jgi:CheY-like chemotaxis protein